MIVLLPDGTLINTKKMAAAESCIVSGYPNIKTKITLTINRGEDPVCLFSSCTTEEIAAAILAALEDKK